ncbi:MAG TPA: tryptophan--tRNA ligase [Chloroflexota bacterium]|nr:tryptophan--tRNA ligase [Chloroflexota bacterium]
MTRYRLLTGDRPTGPLHLGHYVGTLKNRVAYQHDYESYFVIADLHMLTTKHRPEDLRVADSHVRHLVLDALAAGIDPQAVTFYLQSAIPEIHEMYTLLQNLVSVARLERLPSLKEMARAAHIEMPYGLLGYPVLQTADILGVKAHLVPVGKDNSAHVEVAREIARRFNHLYGQTFPLPEYLAGDVPTLVGTDGRHKMSKSRGNAIFLSDTPAEVERKVMAMYTDPARVRADSPGTVEGNPVFIYHDAFNPNRAEVDGLKRRYRAGTVGDVEVKRKLATALNALLEPMRQRREQYAAPGLIDDLIWRGTRKVHGEIAHSLDEMRTAMGLTGMWDRLHRPSNAQQGHDHGG